MGEFLYPTVDTDQLQNELNFLAQIGVWIYLQSVRGNVSQEDYHLVQNGLKKQEETLRKLEGE